MVNRTELATLAELEENLYSFADYAEIESYISVAEVEEQKLGRLCTTNGSEQNIELDFLALNKLYQLLVRESEISFLINASPLKLKKYYRMLQLLLKKLH